jgi:hypothetical protein
MYGYFNAITTAGQRFVNGVINDFIDQMVQRFAVCATYVHTGAAAHSFQPF